MTSFGCVSTCSKDSTAGIYRPRFLTRISSREESERSTCERHVQSDPKRKVHKKKIFAEGFQLKHLRDIKEKWTYGNETIRKRIRLSRKSIFYPLPNTVNKTTLKRFMSQRKNQRLRRKGRRFSRVEEIFTLTLYEEGSKRYEFLSKTFNVPSNKLLKLLSKVPLECGINPQVFESLKNAVSKLYGMDRYCVLMFEEIALSTLLSYNPSGDCIEGIVDMGGGDRRPKLADRALVFMIRGVKGKWKQPISFYFAEGSVQSSDLVKKIREVVRFVRQLGLRVLATVCDHKKNNVAAVNRLLQETREYCLRNAVRNNYQGYLIDGREIVHLYDPPHLLKGIRNDFSKRDLHFCHKGVEKIASWSHIVDLYNVEKLHKVKTTYKLTDKHVLPHKIDKRKVRYASQVFSQKVCAIMSFKASLSRRLLAKFHLDPSAGKTADAIFLFNYLFDSVNGELVYPEHYQPLLGIVTSESLHFNYWKDALEFLGSMYFKDKYSPNRVVTPSLKHFIFTIRGFLYIWKLLLKKKDYDSFKARKFNQDPLENLFAQLRSLGGRTVSPTCSSLITSLKYLVMNNFSSHAYEESNCEDDECKALSTLGNVALKKTETSQPPVYGLERSMVLDVHSQVATRNVTAYLVKKFLKIICRCPDCLKIIESHYFIPRDLLIKAETRRGCKTLNRFKTFNKIFLKFSWQIFTAISRNIHTFGIQGKILAELDSDMIRMLFCHAHESDHVEFVKFSVNFILLFYIETVNKILCGKRTKLYSDPIMQMASDKFRKRRCN